MDKEFHALIFHIKKTRVRTLPAMFAHSRCTNKSSPLASLKKNVKHRSSLRSAAARDGKKRATTNAKTTTSFPNNNFDDDEERFAQKQHQQRVDGEEDAVEKSTRRAFFKATTSSAAFAAFVLASGDVVAFPPSASAIGFQKELKPKRVALNDLNLQTSQPFQFRGEEHAGVQYGDARVGDGKELKPGALATIHFDVKLRGLTVLSTRTARTLGGNRTVSEPMQFSYGKLPTEYSKPLKRKTVNGIGAEVRIDPELGELYVVKVSPDGPAAKAGFKANDVILEIDGTKNLANLPIQEIGALLLGPVETTVDVTVQKGGSRAGPDAPVEKYTLTREATVIVPKKQNANANIEGGGGLFNGETGPAIPPVVYVPGALEGMKVGGRRILKTPADLGYADQGEGEIPPGSEIVVEVELLEVKDA